MTHHSSRFLKCTWTIAAPLWSSRSSFELRHFQSYHLYHHHQQVFLSYYMSSLSWLMVILIGSLLSLLVDRYYSVNRKLSNSFRLLTERAFYICWIYIGDDHSSEVGLSDAESVTTSSSLSHQWISVRLVRVEPDSVQLEWSSHPPSVRQQFVNCQARYGLLTPSRTFTQVRNALSLLYDYPIKTTPYSPHIQFAGFQEL